MRYQVIIPALVAASGLIAGSGGCGQAKISECNALIEVINKGVQSFEKGQKPGSDSTSVADLKAMADAMDKVAADASQVKLTIPELQKFSTDYQGMAKEVAKAFRDVAAAVDAKDQEKADSAQASMDRAVKQEEPLVQSINKFCQAP